MYQKLYLVLMTVLVAMFLLQDAEGQSVIVGVSAWGIHVFHNNRLINKFVW